MLQDFLALTENLLDGRGCDFGEFGFSHLLEFDLLPLLANLVEQRLARPDAESDDHDADHDSARDGKFEEPDCVARAEKQSRQPKNAPQDDKSVSPRWATK